MNLRIFPPEGFLEARVTLPLSKSMSARALIINALTPGAPALTRLAECDDTRALREALDSPDAQAINVGAAGTTMRFLTAYFAAKPGTDVVLDGSERMRERPIGVLVDALRQLGADITYAGNEGFPPLHIRGRALKGGELSLDSTVSSQFISALLMVAPTMQEGLCLKLTGRPVSRPYINMTLDMMEDAGVEGTFTPDDVITIPHATYRPSRREIEGDWSGAAVWYEITALSSGAISVANLSPDSVQGDRLLADLFGHIGVHTEWDGEAGGTDLVAMPDQDARLYWDFSGTPDLAQYAVVTCAMLGIPFHFTGLSTLAHKETDRVNALITEMAKLGIMLQPEGPDGLGWEQQRRTVTQMPRFCTYADHRMAMCLAPISIFVPGIVIEDAEVVTKSYPGFWKDLAEAGFIFLDADKPLPSAAAE